MQNPNDTLEKALELDPLIDLDYEHPAEEVVRKGPLEKSIYVLSSDSFSDKNISFQGLTPPSLTTITDRNLRIQYSLFVAVSFDPTAANGATVGNYPFVNAVAAGGVTRAWPHIAGGAGAAVAPAYARNSVCVDTTGVDAAGAAVGGAGVKGIGNTICLRSLPLQSCVQTEDLRINGNSNSVNMIDMACLQQYLIDDEEVNYFASECPMQRELDAEYKASDSFQLRNPMVSNFSNTTVTSRASYLATLIYEAQDAGVGGTVYRVYRYDITEPLIISPLVWGKCFSADGFANVQNLTINLNILDINRTICIDHTVLTANTAVKVSMQPFNWGPAAGPFTVPADNKCQILMNYNTQDPILSAKMGTNLYYDYDFIQSDANANAISPAAALTNASPDGAWTGNALRVNTIPDKIMVYIKPNKAQFNSTPTSATFTDTFLRITKLNVGFNNQPSKLNTYTEADLYRMSVKNGLRMSWFEWRYSIGSVIIIDTVSDLGLGSEESAGQNKANMLKIDGNYSCSPLAYAENTAGFTVEVMTVIVTQGKAIISPNKAEFLVGGVTTSEVLALTTSKDNVVAAGLHRHLAHHAHGRGGNFFGKVGKLLKHGLHLAKHVKPEHLEMAQKGLEHLGLGGAEGGFVTGAKLRKHKRAL